MNRYAFLTNVSHSLASETNDIEDVRLIGLSNGESHDEALKGRVFENGNHKPDGFITIELKDKKMKCLAIDFISENGNG